MDVLWSPWRYNYITGESGPNNPDVGCVFCNILNDPATDREKFILFRAGFNFVILNIYPYGTGHLMIVPYEHLADLCKADKQTTDEMMDLTKRSQAALENVYGPQGFNMGLNIGKAAGAGVASHFHMHVLPRWFGDVNFVTSIGETRAMPESLETTYRKLNGKI
ncbi:MAG TPA: HIT domain-containing protein [Pyrinomonadaceae bacterium]